MLFYTYDSIQHESFVCTQLNSFKYCYQFGYTSVIPLRTVVVYSYAYTCNTYACKIITTTQWRRRAKTSLKKICLSLFLKGLCVRGSWRPNRTVTYWPPLLWPSALSFSFSRAAQPEARGLRLRPGGSGWAPADWAEIGVCNNRNVVTSWLVGCKYKSFLKYLIPKSVIYLPQLLSNWSGLQNYWLPVFTELYNSSIAHSISPHNWSSGFVTSAVLGMACLIIIKRK